ncbi:MAG TPA: tetratricopeptide repeat protein, partial [bacterium]
MAAVISLTFGKGRLRWLLPAAALLGALLLQGCVYYNTFYNAKRYFREGIKENENNDTGRPKTTNYQKAIDSAARVLEYYPKSKYVDDALLIMGKAYYEIRTYPKARRKFEELLANCPDSPLRDEARLWLGKTMIAQGQAEQGIAALTELWGQGASEAIRLGSQRRLADYHFEKENYRQALLEYGKILEASKDKRERGDVWYQVGECHFKLEEYAEAEEAYLKVLDEKPARKREFEATFKRAVMLRLRGESETALKICDNLLKKEIYFPYFDQVYLTKAEILLELNQAEEAEALFKRILELYPRTDVSAKAAFLLGKIYLEELHDLAKAEEYLTRVQAEKGGSEDALQAQELVSDLRFLKSLYSQIDSLHVEIDTLNYRLTWLAEHPGEEFPVESPEELPVTPDTLGLSGMPSSLDSLRRMQRPDQLPRQPFEPGEGLYPARPQGMEGEQTPEMRGMPEMPGRPGESGMPGAMSQEPQARRRMAVLPRDSVGILDRIQANAEELAELRFRLAEHIWRQ